MSPFAPSGFEVFITLFCSCVIFVASSSRTKKASSAAAKSAASDEMHFWNTSEHQEFKIRNKQLPDSIFMCILAHAKYFFCSLRAEGEKAIWPSTSDLLCCVSQPVPKGPPHIELSKVKISGHYSLCCLSKLISLLSGIFLPLCLHRHCRTLRPDRRMGHGYIAHSNVKFLYLYTTFRQ